MNAHTTPKPSDPNALVRLPSVIALTGMGRATIYDFMQRGLFSQPIKLGPKLAAWPADEISKINAERIAGKSHDEIKVLVTALMDSRKNRAQLSERLHHILHHVPESRWDVPRVVAVGITSPSQSMNAALAAEGLALDLTETAVLFCPLYAVTSKDRSRAQEVCRASHTVAA